MNNQKQGSSKVSTPYEESKNFPEFKVTVLKTWDTDFSTLSDDEKTYCTTDLILNKFLIAREHKIPQSLNMWKSWIEWRKTFGPHRITPQDVPNELALRKIFWCGEDRKRHPLVYVKILRSNPDAEPKEVVKFGIYNLEKGLKEAERRGTSEIVVIVDMKGFNRKLMSNRVTSTMKELLVLIQSHYPERLFKLYVVNANWLFKFLYALLKPFIDSKTRNKLAFLSNHDELKKDFTPDNLLKEYGGTLDEPGQSITEETINFNSRQSQQSVSTTQGGKIECSKDEVIEFKNKSVSEDNKIEADSLKVEIFRGKTEDSISPTLANLVAEENTAQLRLPYSWNLRFMNPFSTKF